MVGTILDSSCSARSCFLLLIQFLLARLPQPEVELPMCVIATLLQRGSGKVVSAIGPLRPARRDIELNASTAVETESTSDSNFKPKNRGRQETTGLVSLDCIKNILFL